MTSPVSGRSDWFAFTPGAGSCVVWRPSDDVLRRAHNAAREAEAAGAAAGLGPEAHNRARPCPGGPDFTPDWRVTQHLEAFASADGRSPPVVTSTWSSPWAESLFPGSDFYAQELRSEFAELMAEHGRQGRPRSLEDLRVFVSSFLPARVQREEQSAWKDAELQRWRLYQRLIDYELAKAGCRNSRGPEIPGRTRGAYLRREGPSRCSDGSRGARSRSCLPRLPPLDAPGARPSSS
jgi:hypothetical protein